MSIHPKSIHELGTKTDKSFAHQYLHVYEALLEPIRSRVNNVLEIGIHTGESHRMWRDYFFNSHVYGFDVSDICAGMIGEERITTAFLNAYSQEALNLFPDIEYDVIIDDGPHSIESQAFCVQHYCRRLSSNGILIVEDIPFPEWIPIIASYVPDDLKPYMYSIDRRIAPNRNSINDELMFVIDKRFVR